MFCLHSQPNWVGRLHIVWFDWYVLISIAWYFGTLQSLSCLTSPFHSLSSCIFLFATIEPGPWKVVLRLIFYNSVFWFCILVLKVLLESDENCIWTYGFFLPQWYVCTSAHGPETQHLIFILRFKHIFYFRILRGIRCSSHLHFSV